MIPEAFNTDTRVARNVLSHGQMYVQRRSDSFAGCSFYCGLGIRRKEAGPVEWLL